MYQLPVSLHQLMTKNCLAFFCNFKKRGSLASSLFKLQTLKKVKKQIGQFALGIWSLPDLILNNAQKIESHDKYNTVRAAL